MAKQHLSQRVHACDVGTVATIGLRYGVEKPARDAVFVGAKRRSQRFFHVDVSARERIDLAGDRFTGRARALWKRIELDEQLRNTRMLAAQNRQRIHENLPQADVCVAAFPRKFVD